MWRPNLWNKRCKHSRAKLIIPASSRPSKANRCFICCSSSKLAFISFLHWAIHSSLVSDLLADMARTALASSFVGVLSTSCSPSISYSGTKIHLQISRIRVARLSICFGLQHWNLGHTLTLFELARRSEGFDQQIKSEKYSWKSKK